MQGNSPLIHISLILYFVKPGTTVAASLIVSILTASGLLGGEATDTSALVWLFTVFVVVII
jgi:hypothetical protein